MKLKTKNMQNKQRIGEIFKKIKEGHPLWVGGDSVYKDRLERALDPYFDELEKMGVARHFAQSLLFFGKEFIDSFQVKKKYQPVTLADIEQVFNSKAEDLTEEEQRAFQLAKKHNALIYKIVPSKDGKVRINVLEYQQVRVDKQQKLV